MDMSYLRPLYHRQGPWASVYLDVTRAEENADHQIDLRWRAARAALEEQGADAATLEALSAANADSGGLSGRAGLALFAAGGEVVLAEPRADAALARAIAGTDADLVLVQADEVP